MFKIKFIISLFLSIILALPSSAETIEQALGENNYLLATNTEKGDAYVNSYQRTYNPSINRWGTKTGTMPNGDAIITLDSWTIADVLGNNYYLLAYNSDRGNCYACNNKTYTPGTNQVGTITGYTSDGRPIINVEGTVYVRTETYTTQTPVYSNPVQSSTVASPSSTQPQVGEEMVYIMPDTGEKYHVQPHGNYNSYQQIPLSRAKMLGYDPCEKCYG